MMSLQAYIATLLIRRKRNAEKKGKQTITQFRKNQEEALRKLKAPQSVLVTPLLLNNLSAEWLEPSTIKGNQIILYAHGGGYAVGTADSHRALVAKIAEVAGLKTLSINYRLAPENPFPAAQEDFIFFYEYLINDLKILPEDIFFMGDSAGGGLCLSSLLFLKDNKKEIPGGIVCLSPWTDLTLSGESHKTKFHSEPLLNPEKAQTWAAWYYKDKSPQLPYISPLFGDFSHTCPIYIQVGTNEVLLNDSLDFEKIQKAKGAQITLDVYPHMFHVWQFAWRYVPESRKAIQQIHQFIQKNSKKTDSN